MKSNKAFLVFVVVFTAYFFTGCFGVNAKFYRLKHSVFSKIGSGYHTDVEFGVGSFGLSLAKTAVKFSDDNDAEEVHEMLRNISHAQVGVYKKRGHGELNISRDFFYTTDSELTSQGWRYVVKDRDSRSLTTVYYKQNEDGEMNELLVVSLDDNELVIADLEGNFNRMVAEAVSRGRFKIDM